MDSFGYPSFFTTFEPKYEIMENLKIRCIAIDDEPLALRQVTTYITKIEYLEQAASFTSAIKAKEYIDNNSIDLIFIDINMPMLNGIELVKGIAEPPMIIFTTAYSEYAVEGFKLDAIDYLLKPFSFADFEHAVSKAYSLFELKQLRQNQSTIKSIVEQENNKEYISVKTDYKTMMVKLENILYLESEGEYVVLHLVDKSKLVTLFRLKNMESSLPNSIFLRVHRSYIVNVKHIVSYTKSRVFLDNEDYLPIGDNFKESVITTLS